MTMSFILVNYWTLWSLFICHITVYQFATKDNPPPTHSAKGKCCLKLIPLERGIIHHKLGLVGSVFVKYVTTHLDGQYTQYHTYTTHLQIYIITLINYHHTGFL